MTEKTKINKNLLAQKRNKDNKDRDEFYTTRESAEAMFLNIDKTQFNGTRIYCNCDSPDSEIYKYLKDMFSEWKLKSLTATCYDRFGGKGKKTVFDGQTETISELQGNGDFRSEECVKILDDSDIIITNPPFTLIKDWFRLVVNHKKNYIVISNALQLTNPKMVALLCPKCKQAHGLPGGGKFIHNSEECRVHASIYSDLILEDYAKNVHTGANMTFKYVDRQEKNVDVIVFSNLCQSYRRKGPQHTYAELEAKNKIKFLNDGILNVSFYVDTPIDYEGIMALPSTMPYIEGFFELFDMVDYKPGIFNGKSTYYKTFCRWKNPIINNNEKEENK